VAGDLGRPDDVRFSFSSERVLIAASIQRWGKVDSFDRILGMPMRIISDMMEVIGEIGIGGIDD
jgi:hypothetical protein